MKCQICGLDSDSGLYEGQAEDFWAAHNNGECLVAHAVKESLLPLPEMAPLERLKQKQREQFANACDADLGHKGFYNLGYLHALEYLHLRGEQGGDTSALTKTREETAGFLRRHPTAADSWILDFIYGKE